MTNTIIKRTGWRKFLCDCGHYFEEATRDRFSPSVTECPLCNSFCYPEGSIADETLPVDLSGNLTSPWSERYR